VSLTRCAQALFTCSCKGARWWCPQTGTLGTPHDVPAVLYSSSNSQVRLAAEGRCSRSAVASRGLFA
jgi:hypothetical protein